MDFTLQSQLFLTGLKDLVIHAKDNKRNMGVLLPFDIIKSNNSIKNTVIAKNNSSF